MGSLQWTKPCSPGISAWVVAAVLVLLSAGCDDKNKLLEGYATQAKTSRVTATGGLLEAVKSGLIVPDDALTLAASKLDNGEDATAFAGAVLDMLATIEDQLPQGGEFEIFWRRIGRLSYYAAERAYLAGRKDEALSLVLAGPKRWQNEPYWFRYGDHDALASIVLAENGQRDRAIRRLQAHAELADIADEALKKLQGRP